jgi:hypothetical protein
MFDQARERFEVLDIQIKKRLDDFLENADQTTTSNFSTPEKHIAFNFLIRLVSEWNNEQRINYV